MKQSFVLLALLGCASAASAQGYAGAVAAISRASAGCLSGYDCKDNQATGFKLYAGFRAAPKDALLDLGFARVNGMEISFMRFGKVSGHGSRVIAVNGGSGSVVNRTVPVGYSSEADAVAAAVVAQVPLPAGFSLLPKVGLAFVSSTVNFTQDGARNGSRSANNVEPYLGIALNYELLPNTLQVNAGFDWTRFDAAGSKGNISMLGLGLDYSF